MNDFFDGIDRALRDNSEWNSLTDKQKKLRIYMGMVRLIITLLAIVTILFSKTLLFKYISIAWIGALVTRILF